MEHVVLKPRNLPEQLRLLEDSLPIQGCPSISEFMTEAYETDPLPERILEAIRMKSGMEEITIVECREDRG